MLRTCRKVIFYQHMVSPKIWLTWGMHDLAGISPCRYVGSLKLQYYLIKNINSSLSYHLHVSRFCATVRFLHSCYGHQQCPCVSFNRGNLNHELKMMNFVWRGLSYKYMGFGLENDRYSSLRLFLCLGFEQHYIYLFSFVNSKPDNFIPTSIWRCCPFLGLLPSWCRSRQI